MKRILSITLAASVVVAVGTGCHKHKKHVVDAGVEVVDAGSVAAAAVVDAGSAVKDAGVAAAAANVPAERVSLVLLSGTIARDAAGIAKVGVQLAPAPPGQGASPPGATSTTQLVITRAGAPTTTVSLPTSFDIQGIKGFGPIANGTSGNIEPTVVEVPSDAIKLSIVSDGLEAFSLAKKPTQAELKLSDATAKTVPGAVEVSFKSDPKSPLSWVLYAEKTRGDWGQVAAGDDSKTSATVSASALPSTDPVSLRLDATDGFDVASVAMSTKAPEAAPEAPADAGSIVAKDDAGT